MSEFTCKPVLWFVSTNTPKDEQKMPRPASRARKKPPPLENPCPSNFIHYQQLFVNQPHSNPNRLTNFF